MVSVTIKEESLRKLVEEAFFHGKNGMTVPEFNKWLNEILGNGRKRT